MWALAKRVFAGGQANALVVRGEVVEREVIALAGEGERRVLVLASVAVAGWRWIVGDDPPRASAGRGRVDQLARRCTC